MLASNIAQSFKSKPTWPYPIGELGKPWTTAEKIKWREERTKYHRSYKNDVLSELDHPDIASLFEKVSYGTLSHGDNYPLYALKSKSFDPKNNKPTALVTGGVHGYETSGVKGALLFCRSESGARRYIPQFNLIVIPCVSPWAYERIQRWNHDAVDPNRNFYSQGGEAEECRHLMNFLNELNVENWACHVDLHETTDTDVTEFCPAKDAKDGSDRHESEPVPDGFYLVGDSERPRPEFYGRIIEEVAKVTHIAPPDGNNKILGYDVVNGCLMIPSSLLHLCASVTNAEFTTTTEVYPDSERATDDICNEAQVAAIKGALDYVSSIIR